MTQPPPPYGQPPQGQPQYGQPQYGQPQYGQPQYGQPHGHVDYYSQFAPQPGPIPLRPLALGEIFGGSIAVIRRNPRLVLGLSVPIAIFSAVLVGWTTYAFGRHPGRLLDRSDPARPTIDWHAYFSQQSSVIASLFAVSLVAAVLSALLTLLVSEDVLGNTITLGALWSRVRGRIPAILFASLLLSVVEGIGLLLCIVPGAWLWGVWALTMPALVIEKQSVTGALGRSYALVRGSFWRVWGIRALAYLVCGFAGFAVSLVMMAISAGTTGYSPFSGLGSDSIADRTIPVGYLVLTGIGSVISASFTLPFQAGVDVLLYIDQRMRNENMHLYLQRAYAAQQAYRAQQAHEAQRAPGTQ